MSISTMLFLLLNHGHMLKIVKKKLKNCVKVTLVPHGCSKAMPGKDSEIKIEIDEKVSDTGMHQA